MTEKSSLSHAKKFRTFSAYANSYLIASSSVLFLSDLIIMYWKFSKYPAKILSLIIDLNLDLVPVKEKESFLLGVV